LMKFSTQANSVMPSQKILTMTVRRHFPRWLTMFSRKRMSAFDWSLRVGLLVFTV
jgi:hypothetical protein